ncbi:hypothetical protein HPP92_015993 [Vanilla planifolia]|uniref:Uncharacterized protein n=1 Tax=Vanilla planifolia TaxID=51239 RepID=A0A835QCJ8_VANPL|nr:hypothetical protein HPP92_016609 [Vanilla planifolia]KAG0471447.1 hypothetical protein HPP92_015993 [Vanilla planifolia]
MLRFAVMVAFATLLVAGKVKAEEDIAAETPETSLLCTSKCGDCPVVCMSPPMKKPPPASSSSSSSAGGQEGGGLSYPYFYFYTSGAAKILDLLSSFIRLVALLVLSF